MEFVRDFLKWNEFGREVNVTKEEVEDNLAWKGKPIMAKHLYQEAIDFERNAVSE